MPESEQSELIAAIVALTKEIRGFKEHVVLWRSLDEQSAKEKEAKSLPHTGEHSGT
jgi:hypothetical protein